MRIPERPPSSQETNKLVSESLKQGGNSLELAKQPVELANNEYLHWDELQTDNRFKEIDLRLVWGLAKLSRNFNSRPIKIDGTTLQFVQTPQIEKTLHGLDVRAGGKIEFEPLKLSQELQKKYLVNSLMEEAIASSQLEGAATSRIVAKKMLRENRKPRNVHEQMILNNYVTMRFIKEQTKPDQKLSPELIKEIHKKITKDTLEKKEFEGTFRTNNKVKVFSTDESQIIYEPLHHSIIEKFIEGICDFINNCDSSTFYFHPFVRAIALHYLIGYLHPFFDGNGRTARALFYWCLISQKYDYFEYIAVSTAIKNAPAQYARAYLYSETDENDLTYFVKFNLQKTEIAVNSFEEYVNKKKTENKKILETIHKNPKLNLRQADLIVDLNKHENTTTIEETKQRYHTTYQTARTDLLNLEKQGYLKKILNGKQFLFILEKEKCLNT